MRAKLFAVFVIFTLLVALLPAAPAGAATTALDYVKPASTFTKATGFASTDQSGTNVLKFRVTDDDLNTSSALTGAYAILGTADNSTATFSVASAIQPANQSGMTAYDLQDSVAYIAAAAPDGSTITLHVARAESPSGTDTSAVDSAMWERVDVDSITAAVATDTAFATTGLATARLRVKVTDNSGDSSATATSVTVTVKGTEVNATTLAETAAQSEALTFTAISNTSSSQLTTKLFKADTISYTLSAPTTGSAGYRLQIFETRTVVASFTYGKSNDTDSGAGTATSPYAQSVRVTSTSNSTGIGVTLYETDTTSEATSKTSGKFQRVVANYADWSALDDPVSSTDVTTVRKDEAPITAKGIALADSALLAKILARKVTASPASHQFVDSSALSAVITALSTSDPGVADDTATTTVDESKVVAGADWITNTIGAGSTMPLGLALTDTWKSLASITLSVADGDTVTFTYTDANGPALSKTATVDLAAPTITGASPANAASVNTTSPLLTALVKDVGAGFSTTNLASNITVSLTPSGGSATGLTYGATGNQTDGFTITSSVPSALAVTTGHVWKVTATDLVGNTTTTGNLTFAVDNVAPTISSAKTGIGLKLTTGKTDEYEEFLSSSWIKVTMSEKVSTPAASAFDIAGSSPAAGILVVKKLKQITAVSATGTVTLGSLGTDNRELVYLQASAALAANAVPKVSIVTTVSDLAGNSAPTGTATGASATPTDTIRPVLTLAIDKSLVKAADKVAITVASDETLQGGAPTIKVGTATDCAGGSALSVTSTGTNAWSATFTSAAGTTSAKLYVCADGTDTASNTGTQKTASFEEDRTAPAVASWTFTNQASIETEDVVFLGITFQDVASDGAYTGDTHTKVTVSSATLEEYTGFGGTLKQAITLPTAQTNDNITYIYGVQNLGLGYYKLAVKAKDDAGNEMTTATSQEFRIIARAPVTVTLQPGWNLVSLPSRPGDTAISVVLTNADTGKVVTTIERIYAFDNDTKVWKFAAYNATTAMWEGTLTQITDGVAYFVRSTSFDPIKYLSAAFDPQAAQPSYRLTRGWNAIGFTSLTKGTVGVTVAGYLSTLGTKWTTIRSYDAANGYQTAYPSGDATANFLREANVGTGATLNADADTTDPVVAPGRGYFIYVTDDVVLAP